MEDDLRPPEEPRTAASVAALKAANNSNSKLWLMLGVVVVTLLIVLLVLPSMVADKTDMRPAPAVAAQPKVAEEKLVESTAADQLRADAEKALQRFLHTQAHPDLRNAEIWADDDWQTAMATVARGDKEFGRGSFASALQIYRDAGTQLQAILDKREQTLQQSLEAGWQYLQENAVDAASSEFDRVIAMQSGHQQAHLGLERAGVREQVLEFVMTAQQAEITDSLQLAVQAYTGALQLDPLYSAARDALDRVEAELRNRAFQDSMGRALQAIDDEQFSGAEKALVEAAGIYPGEVAIKDARERLSSARRQASLRSLRKQAEQAAASEDWDAATDKYRRALAIDSQAAFARNGLSRSQGKQKLHGQLDHYLADTTRLYSDDPLENARSLLAANQQIAIDEPQLAGKLNKLQQAVTLAATPVDLLIVSDNLTRVTVYKVGRFGSFEQKQLSLRPGKYTVTGSRQGYRDVHKVIDLKPGLSGQSVNIQTGERI